MQQRVDAPAHVNAALEEGRLVGRHAARNCKWKPEVHHLETRVGKRVRDRAGESGAISSGD
jgi:hypothetical protein